MAQSLSDESEIVPGGDQFVDAGTEFVPVGSLLPSDSPRLEGEMEEHARVLAECESPLPPVVVHRPTMRVVDGMHRLRAAHLRGDRTIEVRFVDGSAEDVFVLAVALNIKHGMPLSRRDRTMAAARIISSHPGWSDRRIALATGLSPGVVGALRKECSDVAQLTFRTGRDGRNRPVDGAAGRISASQVIAEDPGTPLREVARRSGISVATARDVRERLRLGQDPVPPKLRSGTKGKEPCPSSAPPAPPAPVRGVAPVAPAIQEQALSNMRRDPSMRLTQAGRTLLHLFSLNALAPQQRKVLVDGVPAHRADDVAGVARACAEQWLQFASDLEQRAAADRREARKTG